MGEKLVSTGLVWKNNVYLKLSEEAKKKLRKGKNVIAAHCHNTTGGSYVDFGLFREKENAVKFANEAVQKSVDVLATSTYYTFTCGPVELDVVFTAPQLIDDLDLLSTPINYVSYHVRSLDKKLMMYNSIWRQLLNWLLTKVTSLLLLVPYQRMVSVM